MSRELRGIFAICQTPFNAMGDLLWDDMERECDWIVRCGAHGLVWPVMASEFTVIAFPERVQGMKVAVDSVSGRIPVVIGVADTSKAGAAALAAEAGKAGADAIIALPPWATKFADRALHEDYFRALADAAGIPVMIQNAGGQLGSALPGQYVVDLCKRIPLVQYLKEEKPPQGHSVSEVIALAGKEVRGVFSGASANYIIPEHKRGVCGNMPAAVLPDVDAQVWDLLEAGDIAQAREIHNAKVVFENCLRAMPPRRARKEVLVRRGVLSTAAGRNLGSEEMDAVDIAEIEYALSVVSPFFRA